MLKASHICRTRYIHQVTAAALYALAKKAYDSKSAGGVTFETWINDLHAV
jgi:hypothetical protein